MVMSKNSKPMAGNIATLQAKLQQATSLHQQGFLQQAQGIYNSILDANPRHPDALHFLGILFAQTNRAEEGVALIRRAIAINPFQHAMFSNLGNTLTSLARHDEAIAAYRQALVLKPDFLQAHCNLGHALSTTGQHELALAHFCAALKLSPNLFEALLGKAASLLALGHRAQAISTLDTAIQKNPGTDHACDLLGNMLRNFGMLHESRQYMEAALKLNPQRADTWNNLGATYYELGQLQDAIKCYQQAIKVDPNHLNGHSSLLFGLSISPTHTPAEYLTQAQAYRDILLATAQPYQTWNAAPIDEAHPLRVGFVSGDLRHHPVGFFLESLVTHVDTSKVHLLAYSTTHKEDELTERLKTRFAVWRNIQGVKAQEAARVIHEDALHILIDLSGHTHDNQLPIFAWHPAPVQMSWLGYFASTGVPHIDWILADARCAPKEDDVMFTEQVLRLPQTRLCFTPPANAPDVSALPALSNGYVTFGSFQPLIKLNDDVLALWARVLAAVPNSQLRIQSNGLKDDTYCKHWMNRLEQFGIAPDRVAMHGHESHRDYLCAHRSVDMILDCFPYPGGTTTCEALWMGVPTLTLVGNTMLSRQGAAIMQTAHLPDWVAIGHDHFVALAVEKAGQVSQLSVLRHGLRDHVSRSPLFDGPRFAADWLATLQQLWADVSPLLITETPHQPS